MLSLRDGYLALNYVITYKICLTFFSDDKNNAYLL